MMKKGKVTTGHSESWDVNYSDRDRQKKFSTIQAAFSLTGFMLMLFWLGCNTARPTATVTHSDGTTTIIEEGRSEKGYNGEDLILPEPELIGETLSAANIDAGVMTQKEMREAVPNSRYTYDKVQVATRNWYNHKPYESLRNRDKQIQFAHYWKAAAQEFEHEYDIPYLVILAKMWHETHGGTLGAGKQGALFGIKGKGQKGFDKVEDQNVEYQVYEQRWEAISHFCNLLQKPLYKDRFKAWKKKGLPKDRYMDVSDYVCWLMALEVHPNQSKSKLAYATCGCKDGRKDDCYKLRYDAAVKTIDIANTIENILENTINY